MYDSTAAMRTKVNMDVPNSRIASIKLHERYIQLFFPIQRAHVAAAVVEYLQPDFFQPRLG